jgi:uncharacterized protein (DUF169 family)
MQSFLDALRDTIIPATPPVAVRRLNDARQLEGLKIRVQGERLAVCQQIAYSRLYGWSTWCDRQTSHCVLGAACVGLVAPPARLLDGSVNCGVYQKDQAAASAMQQQMPRLPVGTAGFLTWPLTRPLPGMGPEAVVLYVNSAQAMRFVQAFLYHDGGEFVMRSSGDAGVCSRGVAQVIRDNAPTIEIPCMGDRRFSLAQDFELIVGIPASWLQRTTEGLLATHKAGIRYPVPFQIPSNCQLPPEFVTGATD